MQDKVEEVRKLLAELHEIKKRPFAHGSLDLILWMDSKLELADRLLEELAIELDIENSNLQQIIKERVSA